LCAFVILIFTLFGRMEYGRMEWKPAVEANINIIQAFGPPAVGPAMTDIVITVMQFFSAFAGEEKVRTESGARDVSQ
jgi:hypothetical protein